MRYIKLMIIAGCLFMTGCAASMTIAPDGTMTLKDYSVNVKKDGSRTYVPNRWFSTAFLQSLFQTAEPLLATQVVK